MKAAVNTRTVIRGLYDCKPATAAEIAQHLQADEKEVLALLRELKGKRLARDRRSKGERLWEPWS